MLSFVFFLVSSALADWCSNSLLSDSERYNFLTAHNSLRSNISLGTFSAKGLRKPPASNMLQMYWDCDVESSAQAYANTCPTGHSYTPGLGENLYWMYSSIPISTIGQGISASNAWANEFQQYGFRSNKFTNSILYQIGHATQMSWAATSHLGCGMALCPSYNGFQYMLAVVCQYSPPGNYYNQNVYKAGATCADCPSSCNVSTGLCSSTDSSDNSLNQS